ncbi:vitamin K epoxide reductase family protein [Spirosoma sordidisoli]|uniref:Peptidase C39 domain-containing protein n=1 Tax=Spirosoma sordidisoli TaxID=2502893 RepID=A0A4Q2UJP4_9BACT|nr:vitamin K epoxide reductase family protein [Spirosoma sordidisoli]RYC69717.1 hypothetical protein EQG79_14065 [Spirosoma sordidisoli]
METNQQHIIKVVQHLLEGLNVRVTRRTVRQALESHPAFPSLASLTDVFSEWGIETMAVCLSDSHLLEVSYPFIAQLDTNDEVEYVVVTQVQGAEIVYFHPQAGLVREPIATFGRRWQGISLLTEANKTSGESQYEAKHRQEVQASYRRPFFYTALTLLAMLIAIQAPSWSWLALFAGNVAGLFVCVALWSEEASQSAFSYLKKLCGISPKTDCHQVVNSPAGKLFGWFSMAEIGLVYFGSCLLAMAWGGALVVSTLAWLNAAALPYTIFSVSYQAFVLRKWCTLCLIVQITLWLTFGLHGWVANGYGTAFTSVSVASLPLVAAAFLLVSLTWVFVKPLLEHTRTIRLTERALARFKRSDTLFVTLLDAQPVVAMETMPAELVLGNQDAPVTITVVSNPFCVPCADAHAILEKILAIYPDEVRVIERFAGNTRPEYSDSNRIAQHLIGLSGQPILQEALHSWYTYKDFELLQAAYPADPTIDTARAHHQHMAWCDRTKIEYTPSVFVNGRLLPDLFTINDLLVHLRYVISRCETSGVLTH